MTLNEVMQTRHMVRKYTDKALPNDIIEKLQARVSENNDKYGLAIKLMVNNECAFGTAIKLILAKGVKNYFILAGKDMPYLDEKLGYCSADLMLYAQTLGLNTWYVGGTFSRKNTAALADCNKVVGVVAVGYGASQGVPHKSKMPKEVSSYDGETPEWFVNGVAATLLAPTAMNKQAFSIKGNGNKVVIFCNNGIFSGQDLGLVKYHFELGAEKENYEWANNL